jgi:hypothetical protein
MPNTFLSSPTYERLLKRVVSFDDQPEDVIVRLLDEVAGIEGDGSSSIRTPERRSRAAPGSVLPIEAYFVPILETIERAGGAAPTNDVIDALEERMRDLLTERDHEPQQSGQIRWRSRARFARLRMKERGLLSDSSHRGVWEITAAGRRFLAASGRA